MVDYCFIFFERWCYKHTPCFHFSKSSLQNVCLIVNLILIIYINLMILPFIWIINFVYVYLLSMILFLGTSWFWFYNIRISTNFFVTLKSDSFDRILFFTMISCRTIAISLSFVFPAHYDTNLHVFKTNVTVLFVQWALWISKDTKLFSST